jgi:ATP-dependent helicase/nuclease subunit A
VLCDKELGLGLTAVDPRNRIRFPTAAKRAIALKTISDGLSEELRVLYVALTRARDRLIMTYAGGKLVEDLQQIVSRMDAGSRELLSQDAVCPGQWVLMAALGRSEAGALFALGGRPEEVSVGDNPWRIRVVQGEEADQGTEEAFPEDSLPKDLLHRMKKGLAFSYPYASATAAPSKQTATQRKGRERTRRRQKMLRKAAVMPCNGGIPEWKKRSAKPYSGVTPCTFACNIWTLPPARMKRL